MSIPDEVLRELEPETRTELLAHFTARARMETARTSIVTTFRTMILGGLAPSIGLFGYVLKQVFERFNEHELDCCVVLQSLLLGVSAVLLVIVIVCLRHNRFVTKVTLPLRIEDLEKGLLEVSKDRQHEWTQKAVLRNWSMITDRLSVENNKRFTAVKIAFRVFASAVLFLAAAWALSGWGAG